MSATVSRPPRARRRLRRLAPALAAPLLTLALAAVAQPASGAVTVRSVFASPVDPTVSTNPDPTAADDENGRYLCRPERRGLYEYDTQTLFDVTQPEVASGGYPAQPGFPASGYTEPNVSSADDLTPALQAGQSADLCFGFTLTPNMDPKIVARSTTTGTRRLNDPVTPIADDPDTHFFQDNFDPATGTTTRVPVQGDDIDDVAIEMPSGFAGDPDNHPSCTAEQFGLSNYKPVPSECDAATLGTVYARLWLALMTSPGGSPLVTYLHAGGEANPLGGLKTGGLVYNLDHGPNELARLGVAIAPASGVAPAKFAINLGLTADGRIRTIVKNAPNVAYTTSNIDSATGQPKVNAVASPFYLEALAVRVWGKASDHPEKGFNWPGSTPRTSGLTRNFAQWGTECGTSLKATAAITTVNGVSSAGTSDGFTLQGCDQLDFRPSVSVTTTEKKPSTPTATTVRVSLGQNAAGEDGTALLRTAAVTLPKGLEVGAQVASGDGGLKLCTAAQFAKDSTTAGACPAASAAGDVAITTPLLNRQLVGKVYLGAQSAVGELPDLYLEAVVAGATSSDAPRIKLIGKVKAGEGRFDHHDVHRCPAAAVQRDRAELPGRRSRALRDAAHLWHREGIVDVHLVGRSGDRRRELDRHQRLRHARVRADDLDDAG